MFLKENLPKRLHYSDNRYLKILVFIAFFDAYKAVKVLLFKVNFILAGFHPGQIGIENVGISGGMKTVRTENAGKNPSEQLENQLQIQPHLAPGWSRTVMLGWRLKPWVYLLSYSVPLLLLPMAPPEVNTWGIDPRIGLEKYLNLQFTTR